MSEIELNVDSANKKKPGFFLLFNETRKKNIEFKVRSYLTYERPSFWLVYSLSITQVFKLCIKCVIRIIVYLTATEFFSAAHKRLSTQHHTVESVITLITTDMASIYITQKNFI